MIRLAIIAAMGFGFYWVFIRKSDEKDSSVVVGGVAIPTPPTAAVVRADGIQIAIPNASQEAKKRVTQAYLNGMNSGPRIATMGGFAYGNVSTVQNLK